MTPVKIAPEFEEFAFTYAGGKQGQITSKLEATPVILEKCSKTGSNQYATKVTCTQQAKKQGKIGYTVTVTYPVTSGQVLPIPEGHVKLDNGQTQNLDCLFQKTNQGLELKCKSPHIPVIAPVNPGGKTNSKCALTVTGKKNDRVR